MVVVFTLIIATVCTGLNIMCFVIGAKVGQKVINNEPIELPKVNPMEVIRERQVRQRAEKEKKRDEIIMSNIENYDGTGAGQKDVPMG